MQALAQRHSCTPLEDDVVAQLPAQLQRRQLGVAITANHRVLAHHPCQRGLPSPPTLSILCGWADTSKTTTCT